MRQEIEVKAKLNDSKAIEAGLAALGCVISEPVVQEDTVFINFTGPYNHMITKANFLRIRKTKGKVIFTVKQSLKTELDCYEHEVEVNDAAEMREAILLLGYRESVKINKVRRTTHYHGYEICLDEVDQLGTFIEVEKITEDEDPEIVQAELFYFLKSLGVKESDRVTNGYDTLIWEKEQGIS